MNFDEIWWPQTAADRHQRPDIRRPVRRKAARVLPADAEHLGDGLGLQERVRAAGERRLHLPAHPRHGDQHRRAASRIRYDDLVDPTSADINLPDPITRVKPYPQYARISMLQSSQNNQYKALLVKIEKRLSRNYQYMVSYTMAKADDSMTAQHPGGLLRLPAGRQPVGGRPAASPGPERHRAAAVPDAGVGDRGLPVAAPLQPRQLARHQPGRVHGRQPSSAWRSGAGAGRSTSTPSTRSGPRAAWRPCPRATSPARRLRTWTCGSRSSSTSRGTGRVELIAQLFNIFNRANFATPSSNPGATTFGKVNAIQANINAPSRQAEFAIRVQF